MFRIANHYVSKVVAFLLMIGVALIADGFHLHIPRGYIYAAMAFAGLVEFLNVLVRRSRRKRSRSSE